MNNNKKLGTLGEDIACRYLEKKGYKIIKRNYVKNLSGAEKGEIDIIAKQKTKVSDFFLGNKNSIIFIEVKTASAEDFRFSDFLPEDKVDFRKKKQLKKIAQIWLMENKIPLDFPWQIDVISVKIDLSRKKAKIRHFKNVVF